MRCAPWEQRRVDLSGFKASLDYIAGSKRNERKFDCWKGSASARQSTRKRKWWDKRRQEGQPGSSEPWVGMGGPGNQSQVLWWAEAVKHSHSSPSTSTCRSFFSGVLKTKFLSGLLFTVLYKMQSSVSVPQISLELLQKLVSHEPVLCQDVQQMAAESSVQIHALRQHRLHRDAVSVTFILFLFLGRQFHVAQTWCVADWRFHSSFFDSLCTCMYIITVFPHLLPSSSDLLPFNFPSSPQVFFPILFILLSCDPLILSDTICGLSIRT